MIKFDFDKDCCGCRACVEICPKQCISIVTNSKGFAVPSVDTNNCINCHLCEKVCPVLNVAKEHYENRKLYCAYNNDEKIRAKGSSGSVFYIVARYVIENGGCVCGAAFQGKLQLKHIIVNSMDQLEPLMKSKYIQSNTNGVFSKLKKELLKKRMVLFVGTPCQVQALYNFLGRKYFENLILMDFICHGVPSQELFNRCIHEYERRNNCEVLDFSFRIKSEKNLRNYQIISKKDGIIKKETNIPYHFPFYIGFLNYIIFRNSCYNCHFVGEDRISDLTIGDFWGLENSGKVNDFNKGYSMVYVNSDKGNLILNKVKQFMTLEEFSMDSKIAVNYAYLKAAHKSVLNKCFMWDYNRITQEKLEKRYFGKFCDFSFPKKVLWFLIKKFNL